jgi:hypothetical protein
MNDDSRPMSLPPFPSGYRASGVLVHVCEMDVFLAPLRSGGEVPRSGTGVV